MPQLSMFENSFFKKFYFIFKLYIIVLVFPNIKMNPPQVKIKLIIYMVCVLIKVRLKYMRTSPQTTEGGKLKANI